MSMDIATLSLKIDSTDVKSATKAMDGAASSGGHLENVVKKIAVAWGAMKVVDYARDAALLSARFVTLGATMAAVGGNAGYSATQMGVLAGDLQMVGISALESRNVLTMMAGAQMDLSRASELARIAQDAAVVGNINSSEAFQRMIQGVRSGEVEVLKTIGINVTFEDSYRKLATALGKNTQGLTAAEKAQARMNSVLDYGTNLAGAYEASMGTAGKQLKSMERYSEDLKVKFGGLFDEVTKEAVTFGTTTLKQTKDWFDENEVAAKELSLALGEATRSLTSLFSVANGGGTSAAKLSMWFTDAIGTGFALSEDFVRAQMTTQRGGKSAFQTHIENILGREDELAAYSARVAGAKALTQAIEGLQSQWNTLAGGDTGKASVRSELEELKLNIDMLKYKREWLKGGGLDEKMDGPVYTPAVPKMVDDSARKALEAYQKQLGSLNTELDKERILMEQGATAAYRFGLATQGIHKQDIESLVNKRTSNDMTRTAIDLDKKLIEERLKLKEATDYNLYGGFKRAQEWGDPTRMDMDQLKSDRASVEQWKDLMPLENYKKALQGIGMAELKLQADSGNTWAMIGSTVSMNADRASDALTRWMNNTDGLGRSWDTLGDTVRDVLHDMVVQMQKAYIQQKLLQPLMNGFGAGLGTMGDGGGWASFASAFAKGWGGGKATGGSVYGGTSYLVGERGPEIFTPGGSGYITPNHALGGGTTISAPISITIQSDGQTKVEGGNGAQNMKAMAELMAAKCREVMVTESRPGGMLNPTSGGGIR